MLVGGRKDHGNLNVATLRVLLEAVRGDRTELAPAWLPRAMQSGHLVHKMAVRDRDIGHQGIILLQSQQLLSLYVLSSSICGLLVALGVDSDRFPEAFIRVDKHDILKIVLCVQGRDWLVSKFQLRYRILRVKVLAEELTKTVVDVDLLNAKLLANARRRCHAADERRRLDDYLVEGSTLQLFKSFQLCFEEAACFIGLSVSERGQEGIRVTSMLRFELLSKVCPLSVANNEAVPSGNSL